MSDRVLAALLVSAMLVPTGIVLPGCASPQPKPNRWALQNTPYPGAALAIGKTGAGCLAGGVSLYPDGEGYSVMRPSRKRYYGHPQLVAFLEDLGKAVKKERLGVLLVGDLAQPRGGLMPGGHASHQTGIDVDLWFRMAKDRPNLADRENLPATSVVLPAMKGLDPSSWSPADLQVLRLAASDARVERIFVNPAIKRELCADFLKYAPKMRKTEARWLRKIRPWWGHDDHFHVRLLCPAGSPECVPGPAIGGEECDANLDWWFTEEAMRKDQPETVPGREPVLPASCQQLLEDRPGPQ
jgi:penicillin-insensitive murein endopeptidase